MYKSACLAAVTYAPFVFTSESPFWNRQIPDNMFLSALSWGIFLLLPSLFLSHAMQFSTDFLSRKKEKVDFFFLFYPALLFISPCNFFFIFFFRGSLIRQPHAVQVWEWKLPVQNREVSSSANELFRVSVFFYTSQQVHVFMARHKYFKNLTLKVMEVESRN